MKRALTINLTVLAFLLCGAQPMRAGLILYYSTNIGDEGAFDAAAGPLDTQYFAGAAAHVAGYTPGFGGIVDHSLTGSFPGMLSDLTITSTTAGGQIFVADPGFVTLVGSQPLAYNAVFPGITDEDEGAPALNFTFAGGVSAASLDLLSIFDLANADVSVFDTSGNLMDPLNPPCPVSDENPLPGGCFASNTGGGEFLGVISADADLIGSLTITSLGGQLPGADRVQWSGTGLVGGVGSGAGDDCEPGDDSCVNAAPEPAGLSLSGLGFGVLAWLGWRRRCVQA